MSEVEDDGDEHVVYVGRKPVLTYVMALMRNLQTVSRVKLKARGTNISRAVDVAEITRNSFIQDLEVEDIIIGSQELEVPEKDKGEGTRRISSITIPLTLPLSLPDSSPTEHTDDNEEEKEEREGMNMNWDKDRDKDRNSDRDKEKEKEKEKEKQKGLREEGLDEGLGGVEGSSSTTTSFELGGVSDRCPRCGATKDYTKTEDGGVHWICSLCGHKWRAAIE